MIKFYVPHVKKHRQLEFEGVKGWGGKRKGAGRKNRTGTLAHTKRDRVDFKKPIHLTLKLKNDLPDLQRTFFMDRFKDCTRRAKDFGLHVLHFSIQRDHIHMTVESKNNEALSRGMKSIGCRFGKAVRKIAGGVGSVFKGRFHIHVLKSPREMKNALAYVLLNQSKHERLIPYIDKFSTARFFRDWKGLLGRKIGPILEDYETKQRELPDYLSPPRSWLAREGWRRA